MKGRLLLFCIPLLLTGCSAATYDIDVECWSGYTDNANPYFRADDFSVDGNTITLACFAINSFEIQCESETYQIIEDERLCTTRDGKSVRVTLIEPAK